MLQIPEDQIPLLLSVIQNLQKAGALNTQIKEFQGLLDEAKQQPPTPAALLAAHHGDAPEEGETELRVIALAAAPGAESSVTGRPVSEAMASATRASSRLCTMMARPVGRWLVMPHPKRWRGRSLT